MVVSKDELAGRKVAVIDAARSPRHVQMRGAHSGGTHSGGTHSEAHTARYTLALEQTPC